MTFWGRAKPPAGTLLDPSHPLSAGLIGAWPLNEGSGAPLNYGGKLAPIAARTETLTWQAGPFGQAIDGNASSGYLAAGTAASLDAPPFTIAAAFCTQTPATGAAIVSINNIASTDDQYALTLGASGSKMEAMARDTGAFVSAASATTIVANVWYQAVAVFSAFDSRSIYLDGRLEGVSTTSQTPAGTRTNVDFLRLGDSTPNFYWGGQVAYIYIWERALSDDEIRTLAAHPYQMFAAPVWRRYFIPQAGGGGAAEAAAGVVAGVSTVSGTLTATVPVAGASAGVSTASGTVSATVPVAAVSAGVATVSGTVTVTAGIAGAAAGTSTVSGTLSSTVPISASSAGVSTASGTVLATTPISGAAAGTSTVGGSASATVPISGASAGISTLSGTLAGQGQELAAGTVVGQSAVSGSLSATVRTAGASTGLSSVSGTLTSTVPVQAVSAGVSTVSASLTVEGQAGADEAVAGATAGTSTVTGTLSVQIQVAASAASSSSLAAVLSSFVVVAGSSAGVSTVSANLSGGEELLPAIRTASSDSAYGTVVSSDVALTGVTADRVLMGAAASDSEG